MKVAFTFTGLTPLLFHADDVEASDSLKVWREDPANKNQSVRGDDRSPAWTWQTYLYNDGERLAWPADNVMVGLRQAGAQLTLKGSKTYKELTQSGLFISEEFCAFEGPRGPVPMADVLKVRSLRFAEQAQSVKQLGFALWCKRAKVGQGKHVRVRARFEEWSVSGQIEVLTPDISFETLEEIFEIAGRGGQGDWRPACKTPGRFGMFKVSLKKVKSGKEAA